jgi:hypothetical protein
MSRRHRNSVSSNDMHVQSETALWLLVSSTLFLRAAWPCLDYTRTPSCSVHTVYLHKAVASNTPSELDSAAAAGWLPMRTIKTTQVLAARTSSLLVLLGVASAQRRTTEVWMRAPDNTIPTRVASEAFVSFWMFLGFVQSCSCLPPAGRGDIPLLEHVFGCDLPRFDERQLMV